MLLVPLVCWRRVSACPEQHCLVVLCLAQWPAEPLACSILYVPGLLRALPASRLHYTFYLLSIWINPVYVNRIHLLESAYESTFLALVQLDQSCTSVLINCREKKIYPRLCRSIYMEAAEPPTAFFSILNRKWCCQHVSTTILAVFWYITIFVFLSCFFS